MGLKNNAIEFVNVSYSINTDFFMKPLVLLKNLNLSIPKGISVGFIGPNGAGKTTTIKLCAGITQPHSGQVLINGEPAWKSSAKKTIGLLTENQYIPPHLTVKEWLEMLGNMSGLNKKVINQRVSKVLDQFDLQKMANNRIHTFSKGQTQRAGFAQAFLHEPDILILDEPMSGMDPVWRSRIHDLLIEFKKEGKTLFFSSHVMSDILRLSDRIILIDSGSIKWQGTMNDISKSDIRYQVICHTVDLERIHQYVDYCDCEFQPDGSYRFLINHKDKKTILKMATDGYLTLSSLTPAYPSIEEIFS